GAVLNVGAAPDANDVDVAAQHAVEPDAGLRPDHHVADDPRAGRDEDVRRKIGPGALEGIDARAHGRAHGNSGACSRPVVSGRSNIRLKFWIAWPDEPFTRLSMVATTMARPGMRSA